MSLVQPNGIKTRSVEEAKMEAVRHFKVLLGTPHSSHYPGSLELRNIIHKQISAAHFNILNSIPSNEEIKDTLFSIHSNNAPGPDGFNAFFFKETWNLTGVLVTRAIKEFFYHR